MRFFYLFLLGNLLNFSACAIEDVGDTPTKAPVRVVDVRSFETSVVFSVFPPSVPGGSPGIVYTRQWEPRPFLESVVMGKSRELFSTHEAVARMPAGSPCVSCWVSPEPMLSSALEGIFHSRLSPIAKRGESSEEGRSVLEPGIDPTSPVKPHVDTRDSSSIFCEIITDSSINATASSTDRSQLWPVILTFKDIKEKNPHLPKSLTKNVGNHEEGETSHNPEWGLELLTPEDKYQFADVSQLPHSFDKSRDRVDEVDAFEPSATIFLPPVCSLSPVCALLPVCTLSETDLVKNLHTHYDLEKLHYNEALIGEYLRNVQHRILNGARAVSRGMCGATNANVAGFKVSILGVDGRIENLPLSFGDFIYFLSNTSKVTGLPPAIPGIPGAGALTDIDLEKKASCLKNLDPYSFQGYVVKVKDGMIPVMHSDADNKSPKDAVLWSINRIWKSFPETTIALLKYTFLDKAMVDLSRATSETELKLTEDLRQKNEEFSQGEELLKGSDTIEPIINLLTVDQIEKIAGHSEQIMARFYDDIVMKFVEEEHFKRKALGVPDIHEIFTHAASSQDCCWWCSRLWTTMSGPYTLNDGTSINRRVFMTGGADYGIRYFSNINEPLMPKGSRDASVLTKIQDPLNLLGMPRILFDYAPLEVVAAAAGAGGEI